MFCEELKCQSIEEIYVLLLMNPSAGITVLSRGTDIGYKDNSLLTPHMCGNGEFVYKI
jgi:hypothetical protein